MEFNFPNKIGTGITRLLPQVSPECVELIKLLLSYNPDDRITASEALRHEYFRDFWEIDQVKEHERSMYI